MCNLKIIKTGIMVQTLVLSAAIIVVSSCSSPEKGACVTSFGCSPDTTAAACQLVFGDNITFYEGRTCESLGFGSA